MTCWACSLPQASMPQSRRPYPHSTWAHWQAASFVWVQYEVALEMTRVMQPCCLVLAVNSQR